MLSHFKRETYACLALWALAAVATTATAQTAPSKDQEPALQEIIVTGSLIKRTDIETPSPVQVISSTQIQEMGYTNVSQVLANLAANGQGTLSQSFGQAFAAGASGVALRGLTVGDTLVLIDGKRMTPYPLSDDNQRSFTDISAIPFNAIERVEVLKDGASAIYGADAIAGVVNIILKKSYTGAEFTAEAGTSQRGDGTTEHLSGLYGLGDLDADGYNAYIAVDFHHQDQILASNRSGGFANLDWSGIGGFNTTPGNDGPGTNAGYYPFDGYPNSVTGYLLNPSAQNANGTYANGLPAQAFLPGCSATKQVLNQCEYTINGLQIQPTSEQINAIAKFTKALGSDWTTSVTGSVFNSQAEQVCCSYQSTDVGTGGITNFAFGPGTNPALVSQPLITVPGNYPGNPYGAAATLIYNVKELGVPWTTTDTNTYRFVWDIKGSSWGWDIDGSLGAMYSRMDETFNNSLNASEFQTALNNGYVIGPNASNQQAVSQFAQPVYTYPTSTLDIADLHGSKALFQLPGGPFSLALGTQFFHKVQNATAPAAIADGQVEGDPVYAIGSQNDVAAFMEIDAQVFKQLEVDGAVRYDNYNNGVGGATTPKFSVKYKPFDMLALRGTWGRGFRAPSPAEGGESGEVFGQAGSVADPILCPNPSNPNAKGNYPSQCTVDLIGYQVAGKNLAPVKSLNETFGFIFEPSPMFNVSTDYYKIAIHNDIISQSTFGQGDYIPGSLTRGPTATIPYCTANNVCSTQQLTPVGLATFADYPYINAGATQTEGIDVDAQLHFDLGIAGKLSAELNYTHVIEYNVVELGVTYDLAGTHGPSEVSGDTGNPKDRAVFTLSWDKGPVSVTATTNYSSHFSITDPSEGLSTCEEAADSGSTSAYGYRFTGAVPGYLCTVHTFVSENLYAKYAVNDHLAVHAAVNNLFGAQAPIDVQTYGGGGQLAYDGSLNQDGAIGRFFLIGASYKF